MNNALKRAWKCSEIGWFSNVLCLRDWASVHASQLAYKEIPEESAYPHSDPITEDANIMSALQSAGSRRRRSTSSEMNVDLNNLSNDQILLLDVLEDIVFSKESSGRDGIAVSKLFFNLLKQKNAGSSTTKWNDLIGSMSNSKYVDHRLLCSLSGALFQHGWIVLYRQEGRGEENQQHHISLQPYWILPIESFIHKGDGLDALERLASLMIRTFRNALGHYDILLAKLACIWTYVQFNIFHILIVNGIVDDHENHGDHWYDDYAESEISSSKSALVGNDKSNSFVFAIKSSLRQRMNGEPMDLSLLQTYLSWWWTMFNMSEVMPESMSEKGVRMTFKMLNDAISGIK